MIGHDLGAHVASYTGHRLYGIGRITGMVLRFFPNPIENHYVTGLDPSTIYFEGGDIATHLDPTDALLVDTVHTDKTFPSLGRNHVGLGFETNLGRFNCHYFIILTIHRIILF